MENRKWKNGKYVSTQRCAMLQETVLREATARKTTNNGDKNDKEGGTVTVAVEILFLVVTSHLIYIVIATGFLFSNAKIYEIQFKAPG